MSKPNYAFAKRQREMAKKQKDEEKRRRKEEALRNPDALGNPVEEEPQAAEEATEAGGE